VKEIDFRRRAVYIIVALFAFLALAQNPVKLELVFFKIITHTTQDGKTVEELKPVAQVAPGDVLEWHLRAVNTSDQIIKNVALVIPIPEQTYYLKGSAKPLTIENNKKIIIINPEFSYDGGQTFSAPPLFKKVEKIVDGKKVIEKVLVSPEEYTHVRWVVAEMLPKETIEVFLRTAVR